MGRSAKKSSGQSGGSRPAQDPDEPSSPDAFETIDAADFEPEPSGAATTPATPSHSEPRDQQKNRQDTPQSTPQGNESLDASNDASGTEEPDDIDREPGVGMAGDAVELPGEAEPDSMQHDDSEADVGDERHEPTPAAEAAHADELPTVSEPAWDLPPAVGEEAAAAEAAIAYAATTVAPLVSGAVSGASEKLRHAATAAKEKLAGTALSDVGGMFSSWTGALWSRIEDTANAAVAEVKQNKEIATRQTTAADERLVRELFPSLPEGDTLIEMVQCKLFQTYSCAHNKFTPDVQMEFPGTVYITHHCISMKVESNGRSASWTIPHSRVTAVQNVRPRSKAEAADKIRLSLEEGLHVTIGAFTSPEDSNSAFALLEHMTSGA